jgi:hypothetical protein
MAGDVGSIPPDESHPLYPEWMAGSIQFLAAKKKLEEISEADPEFAAVHSECAAAKTVVILTKIISRAIRIEDHVGLRGRKSDDSHSHRSEESGIIIDPGISLCQ